MVDGGGAGGGREQDEPETPDSDSLVIGRKVVCQLQKVSLLGREVGQGKRLVDFEVRLKSENCGFKGMSRWPQYESWSQEDQTCALLLIGWVVLDVIDES